MHVVDMATAAFRDAVGDHDAFVTGAEEENAGPAFMVGTARDSMGAPVPIRFNEFLPDTKEIGLNVVVNQPGWEQTLENNKQAFTAEFVQRARFTSA